MGFADIAVAAIEATRHDSHDQQCTEFRSVDSLFATRSKDALPR